MRTNSRSSSCPARRRNATLALPSIAVRRSVTPPPEHLVRELAAKVVASVREIASDPAREQLILVTELAACAGGEEDHVTAGRCEGACGRGRGAEAPHEHVRRVQRAVQHPRPRRREQDDRLALDAVDRRRAVVEVEVRDRLAALFAGEQGRAVLGRGGAQAASTVKTGIQRLPRASAVVAVVVARMTSLTTTTGFRRARFRTASTPAPARSRDEASGGRNAVRRREVRLLESV